MGTMTEKTIDRKTADKKTKAFRLFLSPHFYLKSGLSLSAPFASLLATLAKRDKM
jgi:hypothetical protein